MCRLKYEGLDSVQAFAIMENEYGRPLGEIFSSISESPIAAASLGQVPSLSGTHVVDNLLRKANFEAS